MKRSTKAALLSGLIFPGVGHMVLKQYLRGSILMLAALIALIVIVTKAVEQALAIVDKINSGEIPLESVTITELASQSTGAADGSILNIAVLVIVACWLIGIIDSYRLGSNQEKQKTPDLMV